MKTDTPRYYFLLGCVLIISGMLTGGYFILKGSLAGPLRSCDLREIYDGISPSTSFIEIRGYPLLEKTVTVIRRNVRMHYAPFVPHGSFEGEIKLIVAWEGDPDFPSDGSQKAKGVLSKNFGRFPVRLLQKEGVAVAEDAFLLELNETPERLRELGMVVVFATALSGTIFVFIGRRKKEKLSGS